MYEMQSTQRLGLPLWSMQGVLVRVRAADGEEHTGLEDR